MKIKNFLSVLFAQDDNVIVDLTKPSNQIENNVKPIDKKDDLNQPISSKKDNLNQPSNIKEPSANKTRKIIIIFIIILISGGILALIIVSFLGTGPKQREVTTVTSTANDITVKSEKMETKIGLSDRPTFYFDGSSFLRLSYGNNFTGFYFSLPIAYSSTKNEWYATFGNLRISNVGNIEEITSNGTSSTATNWSGTLLEKTFKGFVNNTRYPQKGFDWTILLNFLPIIVSIVFFVILFRMMRGGQGAGQESVFSIGKSQAKIAQSNVKFTDVAGIEEEKNELIEIVDYLKRPEKYVAMGARVPKGVILYGPPGTGKTLLAKAVAGEAQVPFFQVSGSAFEDMLVGVGAKRVRDLFNKAVKAAPAIIFIDEIDSVGSKRGKLETTSGSLADQTLNQLLAEMDGFSNRSGVIVIAATNRLDVLDDALLRPGRFDRHIQVNLPDIKERTAILKIHAKNKNLSSTVDLEDISRRTPGFSGAQLENVLNEATLLAVRKNKNSINIEDLDEAIDRVIAGPAKKTKVISQDEKKQIAYHEAGHALVGLHIKGGDVVQKITIIPRGQAAGYTLSVPEIQELSIQKKSDLLGMVASALGGRASEEIIYGKERVSTGAANDLYKVTNVVRAMVMQLGMSDVGMTQFVPSEGAINPYQTKLYSETTALSIDKEIDKIIKKQYEVACNIIRKNKKELDLIVESLLLLETIVKPQIDYIHKHLKLPEEALAKKQELINKKNKKDSQLKKQNLDVKENNSVKEEHKKEDLNKNNNKSDKK